MHRSQMSNRPKPESDVECPENRSQMSNRPKPESDVERAGFFGGKLWKSAVFPRDIIHNPQVHDMLELFTVKTA